MNKSKKVKKVKFGPYNKSAYTQCKIYIWFLNQGQKMTFLTYFDFLLFS